MIYKVQLDSRRRSGGDSMIRIEIRDDNGKRQRVPLRRYAKREQWDDAARRVRFGKHPSAAFINAHIEDRIRDLEQILTEHPDATLDEVVTLMMKEKVQEMTFVEYALKDLQEVPPKSWHTQKQRKSCLLRFDKYAPKLRVQDMNAALMEKYMAFLKRSVKHNAAVTQLRMLRTMYVRVCERVLEITPKPILKGIGAVEKYSGAPEQCTLEEVRALRDYALEQTGWKRRAVVMWLFSFYCGGIRFGDLCRMKVQDVRDGRLRYIAGKTGKLRDIALIDQARELLALCVEGDSMFGACALDPNEPQIQSANAMANKYLKAAAKAVGITRRMHTHNSRHSFAAIALSKQMHDRKIQDIMGVDEKAYKHYRGRFAQEEIDRSHAEVFA